MRMFLYLGSVPYVNSEVKASNVAGEHHSVYLRSSGGSFYLQVEGYSVGTLPKHTTDLDLAIKKGQRFIRRHKGTSVKPVPCQILGLPGKMLLDSTPSADPRRRSSNSR